MLVGIAFTLGKGGVTLHLYVRSRYQQVLSLIPGPHAPQKKGEGSGD